MEDLKRKVKEFEEWCEFDPDDINDNIRDFFNDTLLKADLHEILDLIKKTNN